MLQEHCRQMRKFGFDILAVVQQYDIIKDSAVRGAMIGNSKILLSLNTKEPTAVGESISGNYRRGSTVSQRPLAMIIDEILSFHTARL